MRSSNSGGRKTRGNESTEARANQLTGNLKSKQINGKCPGWFATRGIEGRRGECGFQTTSLYTDPSTSAHRRFPHHETRLLRDCVPAVCMQLYEISMGDTGYPRIIFAYRIILINFRRRVITYKAIATTLNFIIYFMQFVCLFILLITQFPVLQTSSMIR